MTRFLFSYFMSSYVRDLWVILTRKQYQVTNNKITEAEHISNLTLQKQNILTMMSKWNEELKAWNVNSQEHANEDANTKINNADASIIWHKRPDANHATTLILKTRQAKNESEADLFSLLTVTSLMT